MTECATVACALPVCDEPMDRWPHRCRRIAGHDGWHGPRSLTLLGDPWYGTLVCRSCGGDIHADEPYRRVIRFWMLPGRGGWCRAFAHDVEAVNAA